jgi:signal peptidase I
MIRRLILVKKNKVVRIIFRLPKVIGLLFSTLWEKLCSLPKVYILAIYMVIGIALGLFVNSTILTKAEVSGDSMIPTYYDGDTVIVNRLMTPERGDLVVVLEDTGKYVIKRIVGMPGDEIQIKEGLVFINGKYYKEDYIYENNTDYSGGLAEEVIQLGTDEYFILGDNRTVSKDSRDIGPVTRDQVIGVVMLNI